MSDSVEVLFMSDESGRVQSINCVNPHIGTNLISYKSGNGVAKGTLSIIGNDFLISADASKPLLHVWPLNSEEPASNLRMVVAGKVTALTVSSNGVYCAAAIDCKIYIWNVSSGYLLKVITRHYQPVNKVLFSDDCTYLITAGDDGLVLVWRFSDVIAKETGEIFQTSAATIHPVHNFSYHSLPVTDVHLGQGNAKARLFTVSADQTCKVYSLVNGSLLVSIVFDYILTSVTTNETETELFVGTNCGKIRSFDLDPYPRNLEHHVNDATNEIYFSGHVKSVTSLAVSLNGVTLASGSSDEKVMLWNIPSRQLIRTFDMKGPVTGLFFHTSPFSVFRQEFRPRLVVSSFEKASPPERNGIEFSVIVEEDLEPLSCQPKALIKPESSKLNDDDEVARLKMEIRRLQLANKQLYQFAVREILKNPVDFNKTNNNCRLEEE